MPLHGLFFFCVFRFPSYNIIEDIKGVINFGPEIKIMGPGHRVSL